MFYLPFKHLSITYKALTGSYVSFEQETTENEQTAQIHTEQITGLKIFWLLLK